MVKAVFLDFYGTVVHEDGAIIKKVTQEIYQTGNAENISEIGAYWWKEFQTSFNDSYGKNFKTQRELEYQSLAKTIAHFKSSADAKKMSDLMFAYWKNPDIFSESKQFLERCPVPVYIVSNIDREDILSAIKSHGLEPKAVFTSEDAKSYKPRKELFEYALKSAGLKTNDVVHVGDSLSSDVEGARSVGIEPVWLNRNGKEVPEEVTAITDLLELLDTDYLRNR